MWAYAGRNLTALMWDSPPALACLEALIPGTFQAGLHAHHRACSLPGTQQQAGSHGGGGGWDRDLAGLTVCWPPPRLASSPRGPGAAEDTLQASLRP